VKQLPSGQDYAGVKPVYALALTNQIFDHETDNYYHHYKIVSLQNSKRVLPGLEFIFIELPKFKPQSKTDRRMQVKWLRYLSEVGQNDQTVKDLAEDPEIHSAMDLVEVGAYSEEELEIYHIHMDKSRIEATVIKDAKAEGKAEGIAEGKAEGKAEMIKSLHALGVAMAQIAAAAQLSESEVQHILDGK